MFVFLRTGKRVEVPEATGTMLAAGQFQCLDSAGRTIRQFPADLVVMFSFHAWDALRDALNQWAGGEDEGTVNRPAK